MVMRSCKLWYLSYVKLHLIVTGFFICTRIYTSAHTCEMSVLSSLCYFWINAHHLWYDGQTYIIFVMMEIQNMVATLHTSLCFLHVRSSFLTFMDASWTTRMLEYPATLQEPFSWRVIKSKTTGFICIITPTSVLSLLWCPAVHWSYF